MRNLRGFPGSAGLWPAPEAGETPALPGPYTADSQKLNDPVLGVVAYKRLARKYHPDINKAQDATLRMQEINMAYQVLHDPVKRTQYDNSVAERLTKASAWYPWHREEVHHGDHQLWARNGDAVRQAIELGELVHLETASEELTEAFF